MFKKIPLMRVIPLIVIVFLIVGLMGRDNMMDVIRFLLSLTAYSLGVLLILWAITQGRGKKASQKDGENKREK